MANSGWRPSRSNSGARPTANATSVTPSGRPRSPRASPDSQLTSVQATSQVMTSPPSIRRSRIDCSLRNSWPTFMRGRERVATRPGPNSHGCTNCWRLRLTSRAAASGPRMPSSGRPHCVRPPTRKSLRRQTRPSTWWTRRSGPAAFEMPRRAWPTLCQSRLGRRLRQQTELSHRARRGWQKRVWPTSRRSARLSGKAPATSALRAKPSSAPSERSRWWQTWTLAWMKARRSLPSSGSWHRS